MRTQIAACCTALRLGNQAEAGDQLIPVLESVTGRLTSLPPAIAARAQKSLARALHCQQTQDHIGLADELEHVVLPLLAG